MNRRQAKQARRIRQSASGLYKANRPYGGMKTYVVGNQFNADYNNNVSESDLNYIRSKSTALFANTPAIRNAIAEIADFSIGDAWLFKSLSTNPEYKVTVERFVNKQWIPLTELHTKLRLIVKAALRDGDVLVVLTESVDGTYPRIQLVPAYRIHNGKNEKTIKEGKYKGYTITKGVILNDFGDMIGYNIVNDDNTETRIDATNAILVKESDWINQVRGESAIKDCIGYWEDYNRTIQFELTGIQTAARLALIINAPSGQVDGLANYNDDNPFASSVTETAPNGDLVKVRQQSVRDSDSEVMVFDNSQGGGELKQVDTNRPTQNVQQFLDNLITHAMLSLRWPKEFSVNIDLGGADAKILIGKIQKRISEVQQIILFPVWQRIMQYVVAKAAKNKLIPNNDDWYMFEPTFPKSFVYEQFKDTKSDIELYKLGILTPQQMCEAEGYDYYDNIREKSKALKFAQDTAKQDGTNVTELIQSNPNWPIVPAAPQTPLK